MNEQIKQRIAQLNNGEVPNGYEKTEFGIFPKDWVLKTIGEVSLVKGSYGLNAPACVYEEGLPKYLRITDIDENGNYINNDAYVNHKESKNYILHENDIVFARTGASVGKNYLYSSKDGELSYAGFLIKFSIDETKCVPYMVKANCRGTRYDKWVQIMSTRSGQPGINAEEYADFCLIVPNSIEEQSKIAEILMKWDEAIQLNEQLVEQLTNRKNAIIYNLLTGAFRLPGFSEEWKEHEISNYLEVRDTQQVPTEEAPLMAFVAGVGIVDKGERYDRSFLVKDDAKKYKRTEMDDFIYSSNNLDVGSIGLNKYGTAVISVVYEIFKVKSNAVPLVISEIIQLPYNLNKILSFRQGALYGQYKIHAQDFLSVKIKVPSYEEQEKIAKFICMLDEELRAKQEYLEKIKQQRQALQQYLLNGIVRV